MRIVIDTNLIVSAFIWGGTPLTLLKEIQLNEIQILASIDTFNELKRILARPDSGHIVSDETSKL